MHKALLLGAACIAAAVVGGYLYTTAAAKAPEGNIQYFRLGLNHTAYKSGYLCYAKVMDDQVLVRLRYQDFQNKKGIVELKRYAPKSKFMPGLEKVVEQQKLHEWNGFKKSNPNVLDGSSFGLTIRYPQNKTVAAYGSNSFPKDFRTKGDAVLAYFKANTAKLPTVKESYSASEVQGYIKEALEYFVAKKALEGPQSPATASCEAKGNLASSRISIAAETKSGHSLKLYVENNKLLGAQLLKANGKEIEPVQAWRSDEGKMEAISKQSFKVKLLDNE